MSGEDPLGEDYWALFERDQALQRADRVRRDRLYGRADPGCAGWTDSWVAPAPEPAAVDADAEPG